MRGFIDDNDIVIARGEGRESQSAFMRGFIDDVVREAPNKAAAGVSIRVHARLHR